MIILYITIAILISIIIILSYRLITLSERYEDYIDDLEDSNSKYFQFFQNMRSEIDKSMTTIRHLDRLGAFESDDETGVIFKSIKQLIQQLDNITK